MDTAGRFSCQCNFASSHVTEGTSVFHCRDWDNWWIGAVQDREIVTVAPAEMDQAELKLQLSCFFYCQSKFKSQFSWNHAEFDVRLHDENMDYVMDYLIKEKYKVGK